MIDKPFAPRAPNGFGAFFSNAIRKSIGMSFDDGGLYSYDIPE